MDRAYKRQEDNPSPVEAKKFPKVLIFDVLALNDKSLLQQPLKYRKKILAAKFKFNPSFAASSEMDEHIRNHEEAKLVNPVIDHGFSFRLQEEDHL
mmetsp:Transcript_40678/g.62045  ORF Transcript_40678/g.62045 Transcript_40678/m.62045 type:complete len:96 (-) Transcript_40678:661-948(-)